MNSDDISQAAIARLERFLAGRPPLVTLAGFKPDLFLARIATFIRLLAQWGARINLTARPEDPDEIAFHIIDSLGPLIVDRAAASELTARMAAASQVLDCGSGAGFPGLILASACEARFTLAESRAKRASFLTVAAGEMGLRYLTVERCRLKPGMLPPTFDLVTARALAAPAQFFSLAASTLSDGGVALLYAVPHQRLESAAAADAGLVGYRRISYRVPRGAIEVERILALWNRQSRHSLSV